MTTRLRLDHLVVEKGLFESRERAQRAIMAGIVWVGGQKVDKPGTKVDAAASVEVKGPEIPYVSRGGLKLAKALKVFGIRVGGRVALDVGASTGGFTDCLLQSGAAKVYALDVGYGQLAWKLREDPRVVVMERMNARELLPASFDPLPDMVTVDVSFISLVKVLPGILRSLAGAGPIITLIKPQFEAGPSRVGKKGVVRDPQVHRDVLRDVIKAVGDLGLSLHGLTASPIRGPEGNIEFLAVWYRGETGEPDPSLIAAVVAEAHVPAGREEETGNR